MIKLIASDLDGTLLPHSQIISEDTVANIAKAQGQGIRFVVATGRGYSQAKRPLQEAGIDCDFILLNGAELRTGDGDVLKQNNMDMQDVEQVLAFIAEKGMYNEFYSGNDMYSTHNQEEMEVAEKYKREVMRKFFMKEDTDQPNENRISMYTVEALGSVDAIYARGIHVSKVLAMTGAVDSVKEIREELADRFPHLTVVASSPFNIEVSSKEANKGGALMDYAAIQGIARNEIMTLGDNVNDISMLSGFGITVAMGNACDEAIAAAMYQTLDNNSGGVAHAIANMLGGIYK